ncbi:MAG: pantetheine-phosphate adenylyltransferase [Christensenellaceae bacterium]
MNIVFPGSFDPMTIGHVDIIKRGAKLAQTLYVAVMDNSQKNYFFPKEARVEMAKEALKDIKNVVVESSSGLTVDYCKSVGASYILRGLRNTTDYLYENDIAVANRKLSEIDTLFLLSAGDQTYISASIVRELITFDADLSGFVPDNVIQWIEKNKQK